MNTSTPRPAPTAQLDTLVLAYVKARDIAANERFSDRTDRAEARMERIVEKASKLGLLEDLVKAISG